MTTNVLIVQTRPGLLRVEDPPIEVAISTQVLDVPITPTGGLILGRAHDGECWLVNKGPGTILLAYTVPDEDGGRKQIGPAHDLVLAGQAKEIGIGKGVRWRIREA